METALQAVVEDLLESVEGSRTTVRLDTPGDAFYPVVAEATAPGVRSIRHETGIDLRGAATFQQLDRTLDLLIQDDLLAAEAPPPPELIGRYGARAQMLAPVVRDGCMVGFVSVHYGPDARAWSDGDVAAIRAAAARVEAILLHR